MGFRFRKSVKIGKNTRLNFGKSGVGLSFGAKGLRRTVHSSGRRTNTAGIPGTGLFYTKSSSKKSGSRKPQANQNKQQQREENAEAVETYHQYIEMITGLHQITPELIDWEEVKATPPPFDRSQKGPLEQQATDNLNQYTPNIIQRLFRLEARKRAKLEEKVREAKQQDVAHYREWEAWHALAKDVLQKEQDAFLQVIEEMHAFDALKELAAGFQLSCPTNDTVEVDVSVNPRKIVPERALSLTKTGRLSRRKMTKTNYYGIIQNFVCSLSIQTARTVFALLPVEKVVVHVTENRLNTVTGHKKDIVVLSIAFERNTMDLLNYEHINPADAMQNFEHHMKHLKTAGFKPVDKVQI